METRCQTSWQRFAVIRHSTSIVYKIDFGSGLRLGPGKVRLLELIDEMGSIAAAARTMGMSYRRAWLLIGELKTIFGAPVVEAVTGGRKGGGARLTPLGRQAIASFRRLERQAERVMRAEIAPLLPQGK
jgi:molybdate transport system regulatory protein